ncbi:MAG: flagellar hook-basal body protein [Lacunisphaera sp.]
MNIGVYQSASALTALERWQDVVAQNITSSQTTGYRKRTVDFSTQMSGELQTDPQGDNRAAMATVFPKVTTGVNFTAGETEPTSRDLDVAIQGDGFFEVQMPDGSKAYTRSGEFKLRNDRTLTTTGGQEVMGEGGTPIVLLPTGESLTVNRDGSLVQGATTIGKLAIQSFKDTSKLTPVAGGYFLANGQEPVPVTTPDVMQGYLEGSNVAPLREMVDMVLISRAYEANQKIITSFDDTMQKTLDALG